MTTALALEIPFPVVVLGAVTGMTYGILAVGLILVYRSSRVINFAHGEIGALGAALLAAAVVRWHVPYWVAFPLALGVAGAVGAGAEVIVVRRLRNAPTIMSIVATLGLAQFLGLFSAIVYGSLRATRVVGGFPEPPLLPQVDIGALRVTSAYSGMLLITPLVVAGLVLFLRKGRTGLAIRAAAANAELARMSAVFASRMSMVSWAIAGAVSAYTAILVLPTLGLTSNAFLGPGLLLRALAAAVMARMYSLPVALGTGVFVGIVEQVMLANYPRAGFVEAVLFVIVLIALVLQPRRAGRDEEKGSWVMVQPWPPLPEAIRRLRTVRNLGWYGAALFGIAILTVSVVSTNVTAVTLSAIVSFSLVGLSLGIVTGLGGQLSLGQFALAGVGATASYLVVAKTGNFPLGFAAAGLATAGISTVIGLPALRISGLMLAVSTLGFALAASRWLFQQSWMLGSGVTTGRPIIGSVALETEKEYFAFSLVVLGLGLFIARNVWRSGLGRRLRAVRDNEEGARAFTVPATSVKLQGFALAGFVAGLGGATFGHLHFQISADAFPVDASINVAALAVLGGIGLLVGPLLGALYIIGIPGFVPLDSAGLAATSLGWLVLILYFPGGIVQLIRPVRARLINFVAQRRGVDLEAASNVEVKSLTGVAEGVRLALVEAKVPRPSGSGDLLLAVRGLSKRFGGVQAVADVDLDLRAGETLGLIGPNGAGKTTLFELISGFTKPDAGQVVFGERDVTGMSPEALGGLGLIRSFQDVSLFSTLTVLETLMLAQERIDPTRLLPSVIGSRQGERPKERHARDLIDLMGLRSFQDKQNRELSTGTRRITEIACLLALRPRVLLLDEPSSGIAQRESEALGDLLARVKTYLDAAMIIIEHDIPLVVGLSDRLIAMESGRVLAEGASEVVRRDPRVVQSYLGADARAVQRSGAFWAGSDAYNGRCRALTRAGVRCSRQRGPGGLCRQHADLTDSAKELQN